MKRYFIIMAIVCPFILLAQESEHVFKVLAAKNVDVQKDAKWTKIERGDKVFEDSEIRIGEEGYLGLLHKSGKSVEVKKPGSYSAKELVATINTRTMDFSKKYALFAMNQMTNKEAMSSMAVTGAVKRAGGAKKTKLNVLAPIQFNVMKESPFRLVWIDSLKRRSFEVVLTDPLKQELIKQELNANALDVDLVQNGIDNATQDVMCRFVVKAIDKGEVSDVSNTYEITVLKASEEAAIKKDMVELANELDVNSAMDNLIYAMYYEEKGLTLKALEHYKRAREIGKDMQEFQDIYKEFLVRNLF